MRAEIIFRATSNFQFIARTRLAGRIFRRCLVGILRFGLTSMIEYRGLLLVGLCGRSGIHAEMAGHRLRPDSRPATARSP